MGDNFEDIKKENEALRAKAADLQTHNDQLQAQVQGQEVPSEVKGSFLAKWKTPNGKEVSKKVGFVPGHKFLWLNGFLVPTEDVLALANGKKVSAEVQKAHPWLTSEYASDHLTYLAKVEYGYLEERK